MEKKGETLFLAKKKKLKLFTVQIYTWSQTYHKQPKI